MYRIQIPGYALIAYGVNRLRRYDYMKSLIQCAALVNVVLCAFYREVIRKYHRTFQLFHQLGVLSCYHVREILNVSARDIP